MVWQSLEKLLIDRRDLCQQDIDDLPRGRIKITINANGDWYYAGSKIDRSEMVTLFARQLIHVEGKYYLIAPEQLLQIEVQDKPFVILHAEFFQRDFGQEILLKSNCGHQFVLGGQHHLELCSLPDDNSIQYPCALVENNLLARISRIVFYQLVDHAVKDSWEGRPAMIICSRGENHLLGYL